MPDPSQKTTRGDEAADAQRRADRWAERAEQYRGTAVARSCRINAASWAKLAKEIRDGKR